MDLKIWHFIKQIMCGQTHVIISVKHSAVVFDWNYYVRGKAVPLQAWTHPEGYRRVMLPGFKAVGT
jgi:hypothetical protein